MASVGQQPEWRTNPSKDQSPRSLGNSKNFWLWSKEKGFDLTHPPSPDSKTPEELCIKLQCALTPVIINPTKTALLIIDLQNYDLSEALGNDNEKYSAAEKTILDLAIPAARGAGIQIIWVTTGYSDEDLLEMDPGPFRTFDWQPVIESPDWADLPPGEGYSNKGEFRNMKGVGDPIGEITLADGSKIDAGRVNICGSWNSWLHEPLAASYEASKKTNRPDVHFYKNRSSGMCDRMTELREYLDKEGLRTLLFTGINTDQCIMGTLQDAYLKGYDTIMLKDGCATDSPEYAQLGCEFNAMKSWGFLSSCKDLAEAVSSSDSLEGRQAKG